MFDEFLDYPVHAYNWDDQVTAPSLVEARKKTDKCLIGGINKMGVLRSGTPKDVEREAQRSLQAAGRRRFILAPGCGFPMDVPEANLKTLRGAVG
jgi:uroporphyrinogen decarboxylase